MCTFQTKDYNKQPNINNKTYSLLPVTIHIFIIIYFRNYMSLAYDIRHI